MRGNKFGTNVDNKKLEISQKFKSLGLSGQFNFVENIHKIIFRLQYQIEKFQ